MVRHTRIPAFLTLLAVLLLGGLPLLARRAPANLADESQLGDLQLAIAEPDAKPTVWLTYAQKLQSLGRYKQAAMAYRRFLESDPYSRQARLQCAVCLSQSGDRDAFFGFVQAVLASDPKLAVELLDRPDVQGYLSEARFQGLRKEAAAQSMD